MLFNLLKHILFFLCRRSKRKKKTPQNLGCGSTQASIKHNSTKHMQQEPYDPICFRLSLFRLVHLSILYVSIYLIFIKTSTFISLSLKINGCVGLKLALTLRTKRSTLNHRLWRMRRKAEGSVFRIFVCMCVWEIEREPAITSTGEHMHRELNLDWMFVFHVSKNSGKKPHTHTHAPAQHTYFSILLRRCNFLLDCQISSDRKYLSSTYTSRHPHVFHWLR